MTDSNKTRISVTFDNETLAIYEKLAEYRKVPRATLIAEYLEALKPHAESMNKIFDDFEQNKDPSKIFMNMLADAQEEYAKALRHINE